MVGGGFVAVEHLRLAAEDLRGVAVVIVGGDADDLGRVRRELVRRSTERIGIGDARALHDERDQHVRLVLVAAYFAQIDRAKRA